jgi:hypothetical protein
MIFRWSFWGAYKEKNIELLKYSITSFRHFFGNRVEYIVFTDDTEMVISTVGDIARVLHFNSDSNVGFDIESKATWKKWCPAIRLDKLQTEIYVDSDVFLVKYPIEIENFLKDPTKKFAILDEYKGQPWQHGALKIKAGTNTPFINAGLFIQKKAFDISEKLTAEYQWWCSNISADNQTHHDEQGALAIALTEYYDADELTILPKGTYMLIGENENNLKESISDITLFHAVYPEHPAFYKFKHQLNQLFNGK